MGGCWVFELGVECGGFGVCFDIFEEYAAE
jgi:hypothetical protein